MAFLPENASTSKCESMSKANISPFFRSELMRPYSFRNVGKAAIFIQKQYRAYLLRRLAGYKNVCAKKIQD